MTTTMRTLPHDPYIEAVCEALDKAGPEVKDGRTDDCETRGTYCHLTAVIELDMLTVGLQDERNNLLLIWEWHTGIMGPMDSVYAPPGHLTTDQVAQVLRITPGGVRKLVQRGQLKRAGGTPRRPYFPATQVVALDADRRTRESA